ncbi:MAG: hypothetical protein JXL97_14400 [Bacteroidales bacterium]|nr:hypothetical protein [Bacteroidales bacterium]
MEIKGTSVSNVISFVETNYTNKVELFKEKLPEKSRELYDNPVFSSNWYDLDDAYLNPILTIANVFYNNEKIKAANDVGKYSALRALKGVYKIFVQISSVDFVLKRATRIFSTYYAEPAKIEVSEANKNNIVVTILGFDESQILIFDAISGWINGLMSIVSKREYFVDVKTKNENGSLIGIVNVKFV